MVSGKNTSDWLLNKSLFVLLMTIRKLHLFFVFPHSCLGGTDNVKHENEIDLFEAIDENVSYTVCNN